MTSLVDSGTSKHFLDNGMILVHNDHMMNPPVLDVPKTTNPASNKKLLEAMSDIIRGTMTDSIGRIHQAQLPRLSCQAWIGTSSLPLLQWGKASHRA